MKKNFITILAISLIFILAFNMISVLAADIKVMLVSEDFENTNKITFTAANNKVTASFQEIEGSKALVYTTASDNDSWGTGLNTSFAGGNSHIISSVKFRAKLDESYTKDSVVMALLNQTFTVTKEWQEIEVTGFKLVYTSFNLTCAAPSVTAYFDDIEVYETIKDVNPPQVVEPVPGNNITFAPTDVMTITYNNNMNDTALDKDNYALIGGTERVVSVEKTSEKTYKVTFSEVLAELTNYTLTITGVYDQYNQAMAQQIIQFSTGEYSKPQILSVSPNNDAFGITDGETIKITYDQGIVTTGATATLSGIGNCIITKADNLVEIQLSGLQADTTYTMTLNGVKSLQNKPADEYIYQFTTAGEKKYLYKNMFDTSDDVDSSRLYIGNVVLSYSTANAYSSPGCVLVTPEKFGQLTLMENGTKLNLKKGKSYTFSFMAKADAEIGFWIMDGRANNNVYHSDKIGTQYKKFTYSFIETDDVNAPYLQFGDVQNVYIDNLVLIENEAAELIKTSDLFSDEIETINSNTLKFTFNKGLDETTVVSDNVQLNGTGVTIQEIGENYFVIDMGSNLVFDGDYVLDINIKDSDGISIALKKEFVWTSAATASMELAKSGTKYVMTLNNVVNHSSILQKPVAIIVIYKNGEMIDANFKSFSLNPNEELSTPVTVDIPVAEGEVWGFFWDGLATRKAFQSAVTLN